MGKHVGFGRAYKDFEQNMCTRTQYLQCVSI